MKAIFNISKRFRSFFFSMLAIIFVFSVSISIAYGEWLFDPEITNTDIDNNDIQPTFNADPIRENTILNDGHDVYDAGTQYYDVYFMAQYVSTSVFLTESGTMNGETNYVFKTDRTPSYYNDTVDSNGRRVAMAYGTFKKDDTKDKEDDSKVTLGALLTDDITQDFNRYFKRFRNVAELTTTQIDQLGTPECFLFDSQSVDEEWSGMWRLSFLCWTPATSEVSNLYYNHRKSDWETSPDPFLMSPSAPTSEDETENSNWANYSDFFPSYYGITNFGKVTGWYPEDNSEFTTFYTNTVLSNYDDSAIYINGRKSILVYPVYTVGKNYVDKSYDARVDSIVLTEMDGSNNNVRTMYQASYDGYLTNIIRNSPDVIDNKIQGSTSPRISIYTFNDIVFDASYLSSTTKELRIRNDINRNDSMWLGKDHDIGDVNLYSVGSGRFNIYLVVKERYYERYRWFQDENSDDRETALSNASFTTDEISRIISAFQTNGYGLYSYYDDNVGYIYQYEDFYGKYNCRDYLIYFERVYDSRLVAGPTAMVDYESQASIDATFTRRGNGTSLLKSDSKDRYRLRNVRLNSETLIHYDLPNYTYTDSNGNEHTYRLTFPGNYFGVMVLPEYDFKYTYTIPNDTDISEDGKYYTNDSLGITKAVLPEMKIGGVLNYEFRGSTYFSKADTADLSENGVIYIEEMVNGTLQSTRYTLASFNANGKTFDPESFVLIKAKESGNYTIEAWMQYEHDNKTGRTALSNIIFWGYRLTSLFVNIVTPEMTALDNFLGYTGYDEQSGLQDNNFINTDIYKYSKHDYSDGAHASGSDVYSDGTDPITLSEILESHTLRDYVTGKIYTSSTINQLYMDRNYVLILEKNG